MNPIISFKKLLLVTNDRKVWIILYLFIKITIALQCMIIKFDVIDTNQIINKTINNNSVHEYVLKFKWSFNNFYGTKFNKEYIVNRPN